MADPRSPDYVKVKRGRTGACNICLDKAALKWDHVPPQGGIDVAPMDQYTILESLSGRAPHPSRLLTQNGVKYRTLCGECNTDRLGREYDPTLNRFAIAVGRLLKTAIHLPPHVSVATKPARLLRSVLGHLLAAKAAVEHTKPDEAMRQYVLNPATWLPPELNVFYFVYPYPNVVVIRDVAMPAVRGQLGRWGILSILKYFPIGYIVTNLVEYEGLPSLSARCPAGLDDEEDIRIPLSGAKPADWPEAGECVAGGGASGQSSVTAVPKGHRLRGRTEP